MADRYMRGTPIAGVGRRTRRRAMLERTIGIGAATQLSQKASAASGLAHRRIHPRGRNSRARLEELHKSARRRQCVIIGNGPSLNQTDLSLLERVDTFGLNRAYLLFPRLGWATTYHVVVNRHVVQQCADELLMVPGQLFSTWPNRVDLGARSDAVFLDKLVGPLFSLDPRYGIWEGATVTFVAMQLAYWMGYREVILVGVDHRFATKGPAHALVTSIGDDPNHFDPAYFGKGFNWQLPDLVTSEIAYSLAKRAFEADGGSIVDATVGGALRVFDRLALKDALRT